MQRVRVEATEEKKRVHYHSVSIWLMVGGKGTL